MSKLLTKRPHGSPPDPDLENLILRWASGERLALKDLRRLRLHLDTSPDAKEILDAALPDPPSAGDLDAATRGLLSRVRPKLHDSTRSDCIEHLVREARAERPPLVVVGSGLLAQTGYRSISSWTALLRELLQSVGSNEPSIPDHQIELAPTAVWELVVQRFARKLKTGEPSSLRAEQAAQRALAKIVRHGIEHRRAGNRPEIAPGVPTKALLSPRLAGIVSLNFTVEPFQGLVGAVKVNSKGKGERSRRVRGAKTLEIFYPHGDIKSPDSLALGLRQYALRLERWEFLRRKVREAERKAGARRAPLAFGARTTFVHHALISPMIFAGCGLSEVESTLWWLLATRARNCARSVALSQPLAYFLTADPVSSSLRARLELSRCKILHFSSHTDVWAFLLNLVDSLPDLPRKADNSAQTQIHKARAARDPRGLLPRTRRSAGAAPSGVVEFDATAAEHDRARLAKIPLLDNAAIDRIRAKANGPVVYVKRGVSGGTGFRSATLLEPPEHLFAWNMRVGEEGVHELIQRLRKQATLTEELSPSVTILWQTREEPPIAVESPDASLIQGWEMQYPIIRRLQMEGWTVFRWPHARQPESYKDMINL